MTIAAVGCDPSRVTTDKEMRLGVIGYSPSGGLWCYVQANGAITDNRLVMIAAGFQARDVDSADLVHGTRLGASLVHFADNDYGWLQIWGTGSVAGGAAVAANLALTLDATAAGRVIGAAATGPQILGLHSNEALTDGMNGSVQLNFPLNVN